MVNHPTANPPRVGLMDRLRREDNTVSPPRASLTANLRRVDLLGRLRRVDLLDNRRRASLTASSLLRVMVRRRLTANRNSLTASSLLMVLPTASLMVRNRLPAA